MIRFCLPVSRLEVLFRQPTGAEEIALLETDESDVALALGLVSALARRAPGSESSAGSEERIDWHSLSLTDLDAALLTVRRSVLGDRICSTVRCACSDAIDIDFGIADYIAGHAPHASRASRTSQGAESDGAGWFRLGGSSARFRLPSGADLLAIQSEDDRERELERRCIEPAEVPAPLRRRIEAAMEALAPSLSGMLEGECPGCGATVHIGFDPQRYVLDELKQRAAFLFDEVHLLASRYRWAERDILALPQSRRARYAELVVDSGVGA